MSRQFNQSGFGAVEAVLILIVVGLIGFMGWYVWHHKSTKTTTYHSTQSMGTTTPKTTGAPTTTQPAHSVAEAQNLVQTAYDTAIAYVKKTTNAGQGEIDSIKSSLSSDLYSKLSDGAAHGVGYDQILCTQSVPGSVTAVSGNNSNGVLTVLVNMGSATGQITTTVDLNNLQITSITCPA